MQGKQWLFVLVLFLDALGCRELNREYFCPAHPDDPRCGREPDRCGDVMCAAPTPVCDSSTTTCVQCIENTDCLNQVCDPQHTCVECVTDYDCDSTLCLDGNKCAVIEDVVYVGGDNPTMNTTCSLESPCQNLEQGLNALGVRRYIKVTGPIIESYGVTFTDKNVTIYGRSGAKISRSTAGEVLIIKGMMVPKVALIDLEIEGNVSAGGKDCVEIAETASVTMVRVDVHGHGQAGVSLAYGTAKLVMSESQVHNNGLDGLVALTGATLDISLSKIYRNNGTAGVYATNAAKVTIDSSIIAANSGTAGGVSITGPFLIKNSIVAANGNISTTTSAGGLTLNPLNAANAVFEFNTVADNMSASTTSGLVCSSVTFGVFNSILNVQTGDAFSNCNVSYSLITGTATGTNKNGDPMFVSRLLLDPMFYRIGDSSAARDSADPAATLDVDIEGDPRNDARKDMGADEVKPR